MTLRGEIENPTNEEMIAIIDAGQCCSSCNRFFDSIDNHDEHMAACDDEREASWGTRLRAFLRRCGGSFR